MNIVLIGMPGAGKSTIGVLLAKTLKMPFIDTDLIIQEKQNETLQNIINFKGIDGFLKIEEEVILELNAENHVIATGGSVVYSEMAVRHLKKNGILVYLMHDYNVIEKRLRNIKTRGIAISRDKSLMELYMERIPLYEKYADMTVDGTSMDMEDVVACVKEKFNGIEF